MIGYGRSITSHLPDLKRRGVARVACLRVQDARHIWRGESWGEHALLYCGNSLVLVIGINGVDD